MSSHTCFRQNPNRDSLRWMLTWVLLIVAITIGWFLEQLTPACLLAIGLFVIVQGLIPYYQFSGSLTLDVSRCGEEKGLLQRIAANLWQQIAADHGQGSGSLMRLTVALLREPPERRRSALREFIQLARCRWEAYLQLVETTAATATMLGLGGSLIGLAAALQKMGAAEGVKSLAPAMHLMVTTTVLGCAGAMLLIGLEARGRSALNSHLAELELWGGRLLDDHGDDFDQLFDTE
ncbi:MAG: MotA/TolQ/ExbB proton channel family protein [Planctomycetaceae bacterium]|nr:MotA/TolQ/ExbB proton channel family protein [Planctomycetaceae bacterium]